MRVTFSWLSVVLVFAATIAASLASAQTTQAQMAFKSLILNTLCCPPGVGSCDQCYPWFLQSSFIVTPFGQTDGSDDSQPTWSADATQIAFTRSGDIFVADATGANPLGITNTGNNWYPAWSPDGARIAFVSTRDTSNGELYLMNPDGSGVVRLTYSVALSPGHPAWSPDGRRIAFDCEVDSGNFDICLINSDGSGFVRLTNDPASDVEPTWSPDGSSLAFATTRYGPSFEIAVMNADGSGVSQVGSGILGSEPAWSPDGAQIAFDAPDEEGYGYIYLMNADGTNVTPFGWGVAEPAWNPMWVPVNTPPVASFTFTCNQLTCSFNGSGSRDSDGTIGSYVWNFGDGTTSSGLTVSHTYAAGGQYTVTLTVTDNAGATNAHSQTVIANSPPVASFTFSCSRFTCSFDASGSKDSDGTITSYAWNFGDGKTGSGPAVSHTYSAPPDTYTVTLTVTDNGGATRAQSTNITVVRRK